MCVHLPRVRFLACVCSEVSLCVPLLVTTPLISRANNHALFAPLPWSCDQKTLMRACLCLSGWHTAYVHLYFRFPTSSAPSPRCGSCAVWTFNFKNEKADVDNLSPAVQFLGQRSWLQCFSWLGRLTVGVVALDGIQYRVCFRPRLHHFQSPLCLC